MIQIIGNNIGGILNERAMKADDPEAQRAHDIAALEKVIKPNRVTGLIKGSYRIQLEEAVIIKMIFGLQYVEDVLMIRPIKDGGSSEKAA